MMITMIVKPSNISLSGRKRDGAAERLLLAHNSKRQPFTKISMSAKLLHYSPSTCTQSMAQRRRRARRGRHYPMCTSPSSCLKVLMPHTCQRWALLPGYAQRCTWDSMRLWKPFGGTFVMDKRGTACIIKNCTRPHFNHGGNLIHNCVPYLASGVKMHPYPPFAGPPSKASW